MQNLSAGKPGTVTSIPSWSCLLRAQLQPHNIHAVPSTPAQATPWGCSSLSQPLWCPVPKAVHGAGEAWRLSGSRGSQASPHGLNVSFSHSSEASSHPAVPHSKAESVHGPTGPKTHPGKPRCGVQITQTSEIPLPPSSESRSERGRLCLISKGAWPTFLVKASLTAQVGCVKGKGGMFSYLSQQIFIFSLLFVLPTPEAALATPMALIMPWT